MASLPARIPKKRARSERWRSRAHCDFVRSHACCVEGCGGRPIEVAHLRIGTDAGMGRKASDFFTISLCNAHHSEQHRIGEPSFEKRHGINLHRLAAMFASHRDNKKAREIADVKRERGL